MTNFYLLCITQTQFLLVWGERGGPKVNDAEGKDSSRNSNSDWGTASDSSLYRGTTRTTTYTFPTPQMRFKYYMGDWYHRSLSPANVDCGGVADFDKIISDQPVLWRMNRMKETIDSDCEGTSGHNRLCKNWLADAYLSFAIAVMNSTGKGWINDRWLLLQIGDSHSKSTVLPVVAKTRFSRFAVEKTSGRHFFNPIIFPLEMKRHFYETIDEYTKLLNEDMIFLNEKKVSTWEDKKSALIWRGSLTGITGDKNLVSTYIEGGPRLNVVRNYFDHNTSVIDVAFTDDPYRQFVRRNFISMADQLEFKYILSLEGNDVATGLKWMLTSNSVVFMSQPTTVSFLMEDELVPFVHYVPLKDDYSDLLQMVLWAQKNDEKCKWIADQATLYMEQLWTSQGAKRDNALIVQTLSEAYQNQFGKALEYCAEQMGEKD